MANTMHSDEIVITDRTVRALIGHQFPQWGHLPAHPLDAIGTDNTIVRLGDELAARFPRRRTDPDLLRSRLEAEARALARFAAHSPVAAPHPVAIGREGDGFALPWSVQTWVPGTPATEVDLDEPTDPATATDLAIDLAGLITALREVDPRGKTFSGKGRGGDLRDHNDWMRTCFDRSEGVLADIPRLRRLWHHLRELPREDADVMNHGDLIPGNILIHQGRLAGVIDGGGFGPANPALDLIIGWHLLDTGPREVFRTSVGAGELQFERARAWAFEQSMGLVWYYRRTNPTMSEMGRRTLERILAV